MQARDYMNHQMFVVKKNLFGDSTFCSSYSQFRGGGIDSFANWLALTHEIWEETWQDWSIRETWIFHLNRIIVGISGPTTPTDTTDWTTHPCRLWEDARAMWTLKHQIFVVRSFLLGNSMLCSSYNYYCSCNKEKDELAYQDTGGAMQGSRWSREVGLAW